MRNWIRRSFRNRVLISVLLMTIVPIVLCNVLSMVYMVSRSNRMLIRDGEQQLQRCAEAFAKDCQKIEEIAYNLGRSTVLHSALRNEVFDSRAMFQRLNQESYFLRDYCRIDICMADGRCAYSTDGARASDYRPNWGVLRLAAESDSVVYGSDQNASTLCACRAVRSYDGTILGYMVFVTSRQNVDDLLEGLYNTSNDIYILSPSWRITYSSRSSVPTNLEENLRSEHLLGKTLTGGDYGECNIFESYSEITKFTILLRQPKTFAHHVTNTFYGINLILSVASFLLCVAYSLWLSNQLAKPIHKLSDGMSRISAGDLDAVIDVTREDELGRLGEGFNIMTAKYKDNLRSSVARQRELAETQVRMMQAQLNPHFLYNTLDSIKWMGITNHLPRVAQIATDLAALLRASISGDEFITVEQELELIERYLEIQYIRFEDRFTCEIDVAWPHQQCMIPKLCLQPLVENAIVHGVADMDEGYIKVTSRREGDLLVLTVSDNGCGIPQEVQERLNHPAAQRPQKHLGLYNVSRILRLNYGPNCGLKAVSKPGQGSEVSLYIPMIRPETETPNQEGAYTHAESSDR